MVSFIYTHTHAHTHTQPFCAETYANFCSYLQSVVVPCTPVGSMGEKWHLCCFWLNFWLQLWSAESCPPLKLSMAWSPCPSTPKPLPYLVTETSQIGFSEQLWDEVILDYLVDLMSFKYPWKKEAGGSKSEKENVRMEADFSEEMSVSCWLWRWRNRSKTQGRGRTSGAGELWNLQEEGSPLDLRWISDLQSLHVT